MTDGEALLATIIANPDEDTPRLIYADYLDDNDEPERAAAIRKQVAHARLPSPFDQATRSVQELIEANPHIFRGGDPITKPVPIHATGPNDNDQVFISKHNGLTLVWHRGFINGVTGPAEDWFRAADEIVPVNPPIDLVTLTTSLGLTVGEIGRNQLSDNFKVKIVMRRPVWHGPRQTSGLRPPYRQPDDTIAVQYVAEEREFMMNNRGNREVQRVNEFLIRELQSASTPLGYLHMKWGDKGDRKGHVKKWRLPPERTGWRNYAFQYDPNVTEEELLRRYGNAIQQTMDRSEEENEPEPSA